MCMDKKIIISKTTREIKITKLNSELLSHDYHTLIWHLAFDGEDGMTISLSWGFF